MDLVLDASVILKLVRTEIDQDQEIALGILKDYQDDKLNIILPGFWMFEVGNTLVRKEENFENLYLILLDIGFTEHRFKSNELIRTGKFARDHKVSFYDASYHFLAILTGSTFITADEKYFDKVKNIGNIKLLKDLNLSD